jgi:type I restriction enzyme, S subunit
MTTCLPKEWKVVYPDDVVSRERAIVSGPFGSNIGKRFFVDSGIPVIRGNNLSLGDLPPQN